MAKNYAAVEALRARGYRAISLRRGLQSLLACLSREPQGTIVGLDDSKPFLRRRSLDQPIAARRAVALLERSPLRHFASQDIEATDSFGTVAKCAVRVVDSLNSLPPSRSPQNDVERKLAIVWKEILRIESVGVDDNVFECGGNSLQLARLELRLEQEFATGITTAELFRYPTIAAMAKRVATPAPTNNVASAARERAQERRSVRVVNRRAKLVGGIDSNGAMDTDGSKS